MAPPWKTKCYEDLFPMVLFRRNRLEHDRSEAASEENGGRRVFFRGAKPLLEAKVGVLWSPCDGLRSRMSGTVHCPDFSVLKNYFFGFVPPADGDIDHRPGQVVGADHLVGKRSPKQGVDRT